MKFQMASAQEINEKNKRELETDLTSTKHHLLDIQHQLNMAEKVLDWLFNPPVNSNSLYLVFVNIYK